MGIRKIARQFQFLLLSCRIYFSSANIIKLASKIIKCSLQSVAHFIASFYGQESWAMYHINKPEVKTMKRNKLDVHLMI